MALKGGQKGEKPLQKGGSRLCACTRGGLEPFRCLLYRHEWSPGSDRAQTFFRSSRLPTVKLKGDGHGACRLSCLRADLVTQLVML
jgi:hypothetical protein